MPYCSWTWSTYKQALNWVRQSDLLSEREKSFILGENAARMFGLPAS